jgi:pilus assembly protein CpaF
MPIETNFSNIRTEMDKLTGIRRTQSYTMEYEDAYDAIVNDADFQSKMTQDIEDKMVDKQKAKTVIKDKEYFREKRDEYKSRIQDVIIKRNINVRNMNRNDVINQMVEDMYGYKVLADLYYSNSKSDPYGVVTDIYCLAWDKIYYESSKYETPQKYDKTFKNEKDYKDFIERMMREAGKSMLDNGENKVVDFDLYEDRYNAISKAVSPNGFTLTMRKHQEDHITLDDILAQGGMNQEVADLYGLLILGECNTIMGGVTGSGKTTTMRAVLDYYVTKANKRMLVCEDTRELFPKNDHTLELQTSPGVDEKTSVSLRDLIMLALRQKPKYIVVGEVRGAEAEAAVEAMATGHSTHFTMHAGTPIDAVNRLVTKYLMQMPSLGIDVVERIIGSALDYIIIQDAIPGIGRRITSITECTYNYETRRVDLHTIMKFNFKTKQFDMVRKLSAEKANKMLRKGITYEQLEGLVNWDEDTD